MNYYCCVCEKVFRSETDVLSEGQIIPKQKGIMTEYEFRCENCVKEDMKMPKTTTFGKTSKEDEKEEIAGNPTTPPTTTAGVLKALEVILDNFPVDPFKE